MIKRNPPRFNSSTFLANQTNPLPFHKHQIYIATIKIYNVRLNLRPINGTIRAFQLSSFLSFIQSLKRSNPYGYFVTRMCSFENLSTVFEFLITFSTGKNNINPYSHCFWRWSHQMISSFMSFNNKSQMWVWRFNSI